jgi:hypothetical protein
VNLRLILALIADLLRPRRVSLKILQAFFQLAEKWTDGGRQVLLRQSLIGYAMRILIYTVQASRYS